MNWTTNPETIFWIWHLIMSPRLNSRWTSSSRSYNSGWKLAVFVHSSRERSCLHPLRKPSKIIMARIINCTQNTEHTHTFSCNKYANMNDSFHSSLERNWGPSNQQTTQISSKKVAAIFSRVFRVYSCLRGAFLVCLDVSCWSRTHLLAKLTILRKKGFYCLLVEQ